jgi:hypothetical protein
MNIFDAENEEDFVDSLIQIIEQDTGKKIFTIKVLDIEDTEDGLCGLETLIVFEDKEVLKGRITITSVHEKLAIRMQGNFM